MRLSTKQQLSEHFDRLADDVHVRLRSGELPLRAIQNQLCATMGLDPANSSQFARLWALTQLAVKFAATVCDRQIQVGRVLPWLQQASTLWGRVLTPPLTVPRQRTLFQETPADSASMASALELLRALSASTAPKRIQRDELDPFGFMESLLSITGAAERSAKGVFLTPPAVARSVVNSVDVAVRRWLKLEDGLADTTTWAEYEAIHKNCARPAGATAADPVVQILDPAVGCGVFLAEVVDRIFRSMQDKWTVAGKSKQQCRQLWNEYVPRHLLPRLHGLEVMLPSAAVAVIKLLNQLARTGFEFEPDNAVLKLGLIDTLREPVAGPMDHRQRDAERWRRRTPITIVLGNPPYSGISSNQSRWIDQLLHGRDQQRQGLADYYRVAEQPLNERKVWLQDDYVKFFRYAHWRVESAGIGVVGLITNHGYLDNPTFRGMRFQILRSFDRRAVVDLHGNQKKKEVAPDGGRDQSVFAIGQGTAIGVFGRTAAGGGTDEQAGSLSQDRQAGSLSHGEVDYGDLWGSGAEKRRILAKSTVQQLCDKKASPAPPFYFFVPRQVDREQEYERGFRLVDVMPLNSTAAVSARDGLVVDFDRQVLCERIARFRDLRIPDAQIRREFFPKPRSSRYPAGDTRGWQLAAARKTLAADPHWQAHVRSFYYRPLDRRWIYWSEEMIDWPRTQRMQHMLDGKNLALIARRQMLPSQPCNFFWVSDSIVLDGIIRSDNRGSESFFPLKLDNGQLNYSAEFATVIQAHYPDSVDGVDIFAAIYATFHSPSFRTRYAEQLRIDFPRFFLPPNLKALRQMIGLGKQLIRCHLADSGTGSDLPEMEFQQEISRHETAEGFLVPRGFPRYQAGRVRLNHDVSLPLDSDVWEYRSGAHQVAAKWLKDRRGLSLSSEQLATYARLLASIRDTLHISRQIDRVVSEWGGWQLGLGTTDNHG